MVEDDAIQTRQNQTKCEGLLGRSGRVSHQKELQLSPPGELFSILSIYFITTDLILTKWNYKIHIKNKMLALIHTDLLYDACLFENKALWTPCQIVLCALLMHWLMSISLLCTDHLSIELSDCLPVSFFCYLIVLDCTCVSCLGIKQGAAFQPVCPVPKSSPEVPDRTIWPRWT